MTTTHRSLTVVSVVVLTLLASLTVASGQGSTGNDDPPWRDLARAEADRDALIERIAQIDAEITALEADIGRLSTRRDTLAGDASGLALALTEAETRARELAIEAYISGGLPGARFYLLGARDAADASYFNHLLREHAEILRSATTDFVALRGQVDSSLARAVTDLADAELRVIELKAERADVEAAVPGAEWVVTIASVHALADAAFARTGRPEPTEEEWSALRFCESTLTYSVDTGNGYYGAYQFDLTTWQTVGGFGNPANAPPEEQDARARLLYARRGNQPWPICGAYLP
ncbi:MAG: transglycosylase family protein [Acidimicrobiales bacterium]